MSDGCEPNAFRTQPQPAQDQTGCHCAGRDRKSKLGRGHTIDMQNPGELEWNVPERPNDRYYHDCAARTQSIPAFRPW